MQLKRMLHLVLFSAVAVGQLDGSSAGSTRQPPMSLQELASDWLSSPQDGPRDYPEISNFWGSAGVARDAVGLARNAMPPFACTGSDFPGGEPWLLVDGLAPVVTHTRWTAYEAGRRSLVNVSGSGGGGSGSVAVSVESAVRMQFEGRHTMVYVTLAGAPNSQQQQLQQLRSNDGRHNVSLVLRGLTRRLPAGFGWAVPYPTQADVDAGRFASHVPFFTTTDNASDGVSMFSFLGQEQPAGRIDADGVRFHVDLGQVTLPFSFGFAWLVGNDTASMQRDASVLATDDGFWAAWNTSQAGWEARWLDAFTPKPPPVATPTGHHSGHLPLLLTSDDSIRRVYYMAALTLLAVQRTNSPQHPRVYFTGGQGTAQFFWDMAQHAYMQTMLDPTAMKAQIAAALRADWRLYYGVNIDDGASIGNNYAFDAHSVFAQLDAYVRLTNDTAFLLSALSGVPTPAFNDPAINPSLNPPAGVSPTACDMAGQWKPSGLEHPLLFTVLQPGPAPPGVAARYQASAVSPTLDGWQTCNSSVGSGGTVAVDFWTGSLPGQGVLRGRHSGHFSSDCNRMLLDNGEWDRVVLDSVQVKELLFRLATSWRDYQRPSGADGAGADFVAIDWSDSITAFLECVPNYKGAVPALYAASAWMMRSAAALSDALGDKAAAAEFRQNATALEDTLFGQLYVKGAGYFGTVAGSDPADPASPLQPPWDRIDVRTVVDFDYIGHSLARYPSSASELFAPSIRGEMLDFARRELITADWRWLHALSPLDAAASSPLTHRADHGTTGSYDAWVSLAAEALADVSGNFTDMLRLLRGSAAATREGCYGNNHFISETGQPIKTLNNGVYIANNGVSFGDVILRTLFGFDPQWLAPNAELTALYLHNVSRGNFSGTLVDVPVPSTEQGGALARIVANSSGVSISVAN